MSTDKRPGSSRPKVSIITVCFNSAETIRDTIDSVLSQDYPAIEYLLIDGGLTDSTVSILREYSNRIKTTISERDRGIYDAMNKGIRLATGDVVGMLNSDDFYIDAHVITDLVEAMTSHNSDAVFADLVYVDRMNTNHILRYYDSSRWNRRRFRTGWMPAHPTFFVKRQWYARMGLYSLEYEIAADFEMLVRLIHRGGARCAYVDRPIIKMRHGGKSTRSWRQVLLLNREIVRACREHGIFTVLPLLLLKFPAKLLDVLGAERDFTGPDGRRGSSRVRSS